MQVIWSKTKPNQCQLKRGLIAKPGFIGQQFSLKFFFLYVKLYDLGFRVLSCYR